MSTVALIRGTAAGSVPSDRRGASGADTLAALLAAAGAALDSDLDLAKTCVARAVALLNGRDPAQSDEQPPLGGLAAWQAKRVVAYIEANLDATIRADELAELAHLSTSRFFCAFRETFGETPFAYVTRQRMRRAQHLMLRSTESLSQVALECGFCDQAHFTRVFRRVVGTTPRMWRRQFGRGPANDLGDLSRARQCLVDRSESTCGRADIRGRMGQRSADHTERSGE